MSNLNDQLEEFVRKEGDVSLAQVIGKAFQGLMQETHICIPGIVVNFYPASRTADIQPALMQKYLFKDAPEAIPAIPQIPLIFPGIGPASLHFPENLITQGLEVLLLVCERSIDTWYKQGGIVDPADERMNDFTDSVALVGFCSQPNLTTRKGATTSFEMDYGNAWLEITQAGKFKMKNGAQDLTGILNDLAGTMNGASNSGGPVIWTGTQPAAILAEISNLLT